MLTQFEQKRIVTPWILVGMLLIASSVVLTISFLLFSQQMIQTFEFYLSSDREITPNGIRELVSAYLFVNLVMFGAGWSLLAAQSEQWYTKVRHLFLGEPLYHFADFQFSYWLFFALSSFIGIGLIVIMRVAYTIPVVYNIFYYKDYGVIDLMVPATMAVSSFMLLTAAWRLWSDPKVAKSRFFLATIYIGIAALFFAYAGEEISWGQDFFKWGTPELFAGNIEQQTNLHNYFNNYFNYGYIALSMIPVIVLSSAWLEFKQRLTPLNRLYLPHLSQIGLGLLIGFVAIVWFREGELLEEMVAAFVFFYSLRIALCFRSKHLVID